MPISALPQSTVQILGSSVIITTPCDVVKELIDNAIDAGASFIEVAVSSNYLDTIRVRDDGHGIDASDFDALGRRAHTSKLKAFDELGSRARESLGFRGEALAATNTFAAISITTRTPSDVVATRLQLKRAVGGAEKRCPASAPVGTTVQVTKLFDTLPARKQYSLKNSAKYIKSTKDLLKAYALARPDLRLSFKVLGEATGGWSYAPACAADINEAALQIFGKPLANSCIHVSRNSACDKAEFLQANQLVDEDFILEAFIPKPGFDVHAVKGKGLYLSVDSRPLSSTRGIAKKITAIFKNHLSRVISRNESCISTSSPFLRLNIRCPAYSYDANVAPLKDEVVFGDESKITACFEGLCRRIYHERFVDDPFLTPTLSRSEEGVKDSIIHIQNSEDICTKDLNTFRDTSHSDHLNDEATASQPLTREPDSQTGVSLTKMRTSKIVNMSRINSDSTDEDNIINSIDIQVPFLLMTAAQSQPSQKPQVPKISASENIERYLLSRKNEDFQIATDETATKKSHLRTVPPESPPSIFNRMPLQPLTESMLNAMNGQPESESDVSSAEPDTSTMDGSTERIINANPREVRAQQISPVPTPSSLDHEPLALRSPRQLRSVAEWLPPPSSGFLRNVRSSNSPFRPLQRTAERDSPTGNIAVQPRPRAQQSGRIIPFTLPGENRNRRRAAHDQTIEQDVEMQRTNPRDIRPQLYFRGVQGLNHQQGSPTDAFELASPPDTTRQHVSQLDFRSHEPGHRSHIAQLPLLDGQYPGALPSSRASQDGFNTHDSLSVTSQRDIRPSIETSVCDNPQNRVPFRNTHGKLEDPRLYLIKRRRSQARHGIARRLSSRRLPLEVTPNHLAMQNSSTSRRLSMRKVKTLAKQTRLHGYDIVPGDWGNAITFNNMEEAGKVESRLQHVVDSWKQTQNQAIEVEYKLRSAAKGKNTAFTDQ